MRTAARRHGIGHPEVRETRAAAEPEWRHRDEPAGGGQTTADRTDARHAAGRWAASRPSSEQLSLL